MIIKGRRKMKIEVKDYYAIKRGNARSQKLSGDERKEIAKRAAQKRWSKIRSFKQTTDVVK